MSKSRKTVDVSYVLARVNAMLAAPDSDYCNESTRKGAATILECVLHETGNYNGFNYLDWMNGGFDRWVADGEPKDTDPYLGDKTRRVYYSSAAIKAPKEGAKVGYDFPCALV